ncbi:putative basic proline-rich protein-like [Iris pallida]|nr:putative basic proline-rich protein-like [Iris pallida]KAJ6850037.1 putative basic proline-rich protein-like [Iris pallida]
MSWWFGRWWGLRCQPRGGEEGGDGGDGLCRVRSVRWYRVCRVGGVSRHEVDECKYWNEIWLSQTRCTMGLWYGKKTWRSTCLYI